MKTVSVENLSSRTSVTLLLAAKLVSAIEESGASQTEAVAALGVANCLLPTLGMRSLNEEDDSVPGVP